MDVDISVAKDKENPQVKLYLPFLNLRFIRDDDLSAWLDEQASIFPWFTQDVVNTILNDRETKLDVQNIRMICDVYELSREYFEKLKNEYLLLLGGKKEQLDIFYYNVYKAAKDKYNNCIIFSRTGISSTVNLNFHEEYKEISISKIVLYYEIMNEIFKNTEGFEDSKYDMENRLLNLNIEIERATKNLEIYENKRKEVAALKEPAAYWDQLSLSYLERSWFSAIAMFLLVVAAGVGIGVLVWNGKSLLAIAVNVQAGSQLSGGLSALSANYPIIAAFIFLVTLVFWTLRFLAKLYVSTLHLSRDCKERSTMALTYLSLQEKSDFGVAERMFFYQTLFTPCTSGLVKTPGLQTPLEALIRVFEAQCAKPQPEPQTANKQ